jgi:hypothetical protein
LTASCIRWLWGNWKRRVCTKKTIGVVSGFKHVSVYLQQKRGGVPLHRTLVTYSVKGVEYTRPGEKATPFCNFEEGQKVTVFYDPSRPRLCYILEEGRAILPILTPLAFAIVAMIMAWVLHLVTS